MLVDLVALDGYSLDTATTFRLAPGGAPANVAVAVRRLGETAAFLGKTGDDPFGTLLLRTLTEVGVDVRGFTVAQGFQTMLAFVATGGDGSRSFAFYEGRTAESRFGAADLNHEMIERAAVYHFGSISLIQPSFRAATLRGAKIARAAGRLVTIDPNVRLELWPSVDVLRARTAEALSLVDVIKLSLEELELVTCESDLSVGCEALRAHGARLAVVTLGAEGCYFQTVDRDGRVPGFPLTVVDALGAGDAFMGALISQLVGTSLAEFRIAETPLDIETMLRFANAAGAIATTTHGAIPALPTRAQVEMLMTSEAHESLSSS